MKTSARIGATGGAAAALTLATGVIAHSEGKRNDPYWDIARVRTVCYGETANVQERRYSDAECDALLANSVQKHGEPVLKIMPADAPVEVAASHVSLAYNIGVTAYLGSSAARYAKAGDYGRACQAIGAWNKVRQWPSGKLVVSKGLQNRRADEMALCIRGLLR